MVRGDHTGAAYSRMGLTKPLKMSGSVHVVVSFADYGHGSICLVYFCVDVAFKGKLIINVYSKILFHIWEI